MCVNKIIKRVSAGICSVIVIIVGNGHSNHYSLVPSCNCVYLVYKDFSSVETNELKLISLVIIY